MCHICLSALSHLRFIRAKKQWRSCLGDWHSVINQKVCSEQCIVFPHTLTVFSYSHFDLRVNFRTQNEVEISRETS